MSTGGLLLPPGYHPLIDGAVVPGGKLRFSRSGTTTDQDTYSDSTLDTPNANPVVLNAAGGLDTLVYGDPASGYKYRMRVYSSADVLLDTHDDILVWGADTTGFAEDSFTGTLTGMDASTTGTVSYKVFANSAGVGKFCVLRVPSSMLGTSNATAMTMTGLPAAVQPTANVWVPCLVRDNGVDVPGAAFISSAAPSVITFYTDATLSATGFTNSGSKGLIGGTQIAYAL
jgi:hypothetical protein